MLRILLSLSVLIASASLYAKNPIAVMDTNQGIITLELYPEKAPKTVENFIAYSQSGFYNGTIFHRVIKTFMIQGGGFDQDFKKKETKEPIENEAFNGLKNTRGSIAMARTSNPHSATAQFFINTKNNANLNFSSKTPSGWGYTVFGEVIEGFDVLDKIENTKTENHFRYSNVPEHNIVINSINIQIDEPTQTEEIKNETENDKT